MFRNVYLKSLYDARRGLFGWSVAIALLVLLESALWPSVRGMNLGEMYASFPEELRKFFDLEAMTTGAGFLNAELFTLLLPSLFLVYGVGRGARALAALAATAGPGEHADDLVADLLGVRVEVEKDARGDALVLANEAEQDVLGSDVVVAQAQRFAERELEDLLGARGERDLPVHRHIAVTDEAQHLGFGKLEGHAERVQSLSADALLVAQQPQ